MPRWARSERFSRTTGAVGNAYLLAHEQFFEQTLATNDVTQASGFFNERSSIFAW
jgi:hypothetical protein